MCEAKAYVVGPDGEEREIMEAVEEIEQKGDRIELTSIFGERLEVRGRLRLFSLVDHKIIIEEA